ncbi:MAG TPA: biopolymer transporter Tol [Bacteroidota bacterium]
MKRFLALVAASLIVAGIADAQNSVYGKNKVQYKNFQWQFIQTDHFDIYFSQDGEQLADFAAQVAEDSYKDIKRLVRYEINNRISIIVYNSHNEFQQTNVVDEYLEEGIGGVTELFKNRVILPFEGNYDLFRHVIHHELVHAVLNDMFYGGSIQSLISARNPLQLPMWMNEGLAEYAALRWDTNSDMFIRDATVNNYLPPIEYLGGYFAYRGGQSVWYYIANKYGEQKIGEILNRIKGTRNVETGFRSTIGLTVKELSERWQKEQKVLYYPDVAKREEPEDFARRLTNHTKDGNFYNTSPAISPQGDKIAFLSDRDDYFDIYIMSALDGDIQKKVVKGQRTKNFEELHLLTPGITWSPDGKKLALAVKAGERDAIMIIDVESEDIDKLTFNLDGIFTVAWSPDGKNLAFAGSKSPQSDIYVYNLETRKLVNLTNDVFSDADPAYSHDGSEIFFSSDRGDKIYRDSLPSNFKISEFDYGQRDLYAINVNSGTIRRITNFPRGNETSPVCSPDGKKLLYISDRNGINNVYERDLTTDTDRPITNSLSGIYQLSTSQDGSKMAFSTLNEAGFDVYVMLRPFDRKLNVSELEPTEYIKRKYELPREEKPKEIIAANRQSDTVAVRKNVVVLADTAEPENKYRSETKADLRNYIFTQEEMQKDTSLASRAPASLFEPVNNKDIDGNYVPHKYKLNFTPDLVYGTANYNTFYGLEGQTLMAFSDLMGDHQIIFQTNLLLDLRNSDYGVSYFYLPNRIDYGFQAYHIARFLYTGTGGLLGTGSDTLYRFTDWAVGGVATYPLDRFNRIDLSLMWMNLSRDNLDDPSAPSQVRSFVLPILDYVNDNTLWQGGWFGPNNGSRFNATFYGSFKYNNQALDMQTLTFDYRDYERLFREMVFAARFSGGVSVGSNAQNFFIGGTDGWINRQFRNDQIPIVNVEDYAFLTPVLPLRGYEYNAENGTHFGVANFEFRFPLVRYLIFGALPLGFQNILGTVFLDVGSAWTDTQKWQVFAKDAYGEPQGLLAGTGFGTRLFFLGFPLRIDVAWRVTPDGFSTPFYYFSLGADY